MGNLKKKRKSYINTHRHVYKKKKLPWQDQKNKDTQKQTVNLEGSRLVNIDQLQEYTDELNRHAMQCQGSIVLSGELRNGLASVLSGRCSACKHTVKLQTSKKVNGPYSRWECNLAAVWGKMATGGGHSQLEETMSVVGVPVMTGVSFIQTERDIGELWKRKLQESMAEAGQKEKQLAEMRKEYHEGVPAITVIVDGGWSKRSHKHSYIAKSGVAIIIGAETRKILYIGVRNKYCAACARNIPPDKHKCYRSRLPRWRLTLSWRGFWRQSGCMEFVIQSSLAMVTALCTQLSSRMFLDGAMPSRN